MSDSLPCIHAQRFQRGIVAGAVAVLFAFGSSCTFAQQNARARAANDFAPQQTADALKALSTPSQAVVAGLSELDSIPIESWRIHIGEVPHGGSLSLDDSSWQAIHTPYRMTTPDVVWLRGWVTVPKTLHGYDLTGAQIRVDAIRRDMITFFLNGQRIASGENLEPIVLFNSAKPGDRVLIAFRLARTTYGVRNLPTVQAHVEFSEGSSRPSPKDMYTEFVTAALLIPDLAKNVTAERAQLEKAIGDVDMAALTNDDQPKFDASLRQSQEDMEPLKPMLQQATFHLTGNSHIDAAWLWPRTETVDVVKRTFGTALQLMDEYPNYTYTQSASQYNEWMAEKYPAMNAEIKKRIQEGRWEIVGGMWVEPDLNMPSGESQVRQLLIGQMAFKQLYGVTTRIGWNPDSFGYNWQLPQIYKKSGIDYFVTQKLAANETNPLPFKLF
ncbi:MAG: hypothetical protein ABI076_04350, partial [Acidobacteriaceae bacterium]